MRKIEEKMCEAVRNRTNFYGNNTSVVSTNDFNSMTSKVYLVGNLIYKEECGDAMFTLADWNSVTTRPRLRALGIYVDGRLDANYLTYNGKRISINQWVSVEN